MRFGPALTPSQESALKLDTAQRTAKMLTKRQLEVLAQCAGPHGMYDHTRYETAILNRLYEKGLALRSCNGTAKWHATQFGRAVVSSQHGAPK
jgi:hypothetical protein